ncbi:ABC-F type ribosomal protection protein [Brevibacillus laterosporus]|uniref:ribosomal protection-like ABC-F family protein n=1 Tax=Brevibacillus laterosporus TaxID=1465 RepID=UPI002E1CD857|nr:ABC-F type ribosomal protection protein [Brevibacillus laterosporus]
MIILAANSLSKSFGANMVLTDITCEVGRLSRIGIVGPNGAGKSTLCTLLLGLDTPDSGTVFRAKDATFAYLPQQPVYPKEWTARNVIESAFAKVQEIELSMQSCQELMSNIDEYQKLSTEEQEKLLFRYQRLQDTFEQLDGYMVEASIQKVVDGLRLSTSLLETPFSLLSGGEKTKIGLAKILCEKSDVLLLDEPTNHLDVESMEWLEQFLREYPGTILLISHDRYFLDAVATSIWEVDSGELQTYQGNYSEFVKEKEERLLRQFADYQEQQKKIKKMKEAIKRLREWGNQANPPNDSFHRRAKSMEKALERMEKIERPRLEADKMDLFFRRTDRSGQDVIRMNAVTKAFGNVCLLQEANFSMRYGERKALLGSNGSGKSTFLKMILGELEPDAGNIMLGSQVRVGYLSQQALEGDPKRRVIDAFREVAIVTEAQARHMLARFLFYGEHVFKKVGQLSGGERMRLRLAQLMNQDINLFILDEPTNHLDIEARETLEEALLQYQGSLFIVSHDRYFLQKMIEGVYWIDNQHLTHYEGTYEEAREKRKKHQLAHNHTMVKYKQKSLHVQDTQNKEQSNNDQLQKVPDDQAETVEFVHQTSQTENKKQVQLAPLNKARVPKVNPFKLQQLETEIAQKEAQCEQWQREMEQVKNDYVQLLHYQNQIAEQEQEIKQLYENWYAMQGEE